jgi:SAM-dependent methyltransferase
MPTERQPPAQQWSPDVYARHAAFVPELGGDLLAELNAGRGERILDLGCGDGTLTVKIAASGAIVVGIDASPAMVAAARARGLDARVGDGQALDLPVDGVFSNAALHWMRDADAVIRGVARVLRPGGRFVGELGGHGNVAAIATAIRAVCERRGCPTSSPWFYPTAAAYRGRLERHGFVVDRITLFPRPTPLPTGMAGWLETFAGGMLSVLPAEDRHDAVQEIEALLKPALCDDQGGWTADYVRLRFSARRPKADAHQ